MPAEAAAENRPAPGPSRPYESEQFAGSRTLVSCSDRQRTTRSPYRAPWLPFGIPWRIENESLPGLSARLASGREGLQRCPGTM